ncbi:hypothetical protein TpMuguga_03g00103 [Theileria parva strain Muguga]|uniref:Uncharacterized protein n=1 Tax=Theileria parva TaxID=5875 RepID=Q4N0L8_THEPA|nr:uncharacterized protein TpMuguga_03g00103 [Theileria parva strain Muguga]EAN30838.1 hypothetical protein TpMuguga_03g00103 [Theileria parva strain Muguga]|eukprot:XP_763121.1 hypothetical protein [Theileria parva strain Muguga]
MESDGQFKAELINGKPVLYYRTNPEGAWENITHTRHQLDNLELYDYDLNLTKVKDCKSELKGFIFKVFFSFICYHIKLGDKLVWSYCISKVTGKSLELLFNIKTNKISLKLEKGTEDLNMRGYDYNNWVVPGRPLEKFRTFRVIKDGLRTAHLFGEDENYDEIAYGEFVLVNGPNDKPISYITNNTKKTFEVIYKLP